MKRVPNASSRSVAATRISSVPLITSPSEGFDISTLGGSPVLVSESEPPESPPPATVAGSKTVASLTSRSGSWIPSPESSVQSRFPVETSVLRIVAGSVVPEAASSAAAPATWGLAMLVPLPVA